MKLVYKKLGLMWLNTEETLQAATTFIIYHKNKDTRLQIILCKLEIFCFPFINKCLVILCTFKIKSNLSLLHVLSDEWSGEGRALCDKSIRAWGLFWTNKVHLVRFSSGTDINKTSIDIAVRYRQLFTRYGKFHSLLNSKGHFDWNKKQNYVNY